MKKGCITCGYRKAIEQSRLKVLQAKAKERAKENNEYFVIVFDEEDKKYYTTSEANAEKQGYEISEIISPY